MIDDFARPDWVKVHEKMADDLDTLLASLAGWLRRRAQATDETKLRKKAKA